MIAIRTDANEKTGLGHLMRCIAIAQELRTRQKECVFFCCSEPALAGTERYGFRAVRLPKRENAKEQPAAEQEFLERFFGREPAEFMLLDSYEVTPEYLDALRSICRLAYIDDLCAFCYDVEAVINYNIFAKEESYRQLYAASRRVPELVLGVGYAPVRQEFAQAAGRGAAKHARPDKTGRPMRILVSAGGTDPCGAARGLCQRAACNELLRQAEYYIAGEAARQLTVPEKLKGHVFLYPEADMPLLMTECDLAVSASGVTLYELCAMKLPTICYSFADNQLAAAESFAAAGLMESAGDIRGRETEFFDCLEEKLSCFLSRPELLAEYSRRLEEAGIADGTAALAERLLRVMARKISIVVPCYRVERYIDRCIHSLVTQSIGTDALQLIFVNDASPDRTGRKLAYWAARYPQIQVVTLPENRRQGGARNAGLRLATAPFTGFVDADDWTSPQMFEVLYQELAGGAYDFAGCYPKRAFDSSAELNDHAAEDREFFVSSKEERRNFLLYRLPGGIYCQLYNSRFLIEKAPDFPEHTAFEDNYWMSLLKLRTGSCKILGRELYYYFVNTESTILSADAGHHLDRLAIEESLLLTCQQLGVLQDYYREIEFEFLRLYYVNSLHTFFLRIADLGTVPFQRMQKKVREYFPDYETNPYLSRFLPLELELLKTIELPLTKEQWQLLADHYRELWKAPS